MKKLISHPIMTIDMKAGSPRLPVSAVPPFQSRLPAGDHCRGRGNLMIESAGFVLPVCDPTDARDPPMSAPMVVEREYLLTATLVPRIIDGEYLAVPATGLGRDAPVLIEGSGKTLLARTIDLIAVPADGADAGRAELHAQTEGLSLVVHVDPARLQETIRYLRVDRCPALAVAFSLTFVPSSLAGGRIAGSKLILPAHSCSDIILRNWRTCCPKLTGARLTLST